MSIVFIKLPFNEKLFDNLEHNYTILNKPHHNNKTHSSRSSKK